MKEHIHEEPKPKCQHDGTLRYCAKCKVAYCTQCGDEFVEPSTFRTFPELEPFDKKWNGNGSPRFPSPNIMLCCHKNN